MSTKALYWALEQSDVKPGPWRILVLLCDAANTETGASWLSVPSLVRRSGMHRATVIRAIQELHASGYLVPGDKRYVAHIPADKRPNVWMPNTQRGTGGDLRGLTLPFAGSQDATPSQNATSRGRKSLSSGVASCDPNQELEPTIDTDPAQGDVSRARTREASDLGTTTPGAVAPEQALDYVAACRAAIRKEQK